MQFLDRTTSLSTQRPEPGRPLRQALGADATQTERGDDDATGGAVRGNLPCVSKMLGGAQCEVFSQHSDFASTQCEGSIGGDVNPKNLLMQDVNGHRRTPDLASRRGDWSVDEAAAEAGQMGQAYTLVSKTAGDMRSVDGVAVERGPRRQADVLTRSRGKSQNIVKGHVLVDGSSDQADVLFLESPKGEGCLSAIISGAEHSGRADVLALVDSDAQDARGALRDTQSGYPKISALPGGNESQTCNETLGFTFPFVQQKAPRSAPTRLATSPAFFSSMCRPADYPSLDAYLTAQGR